MLSLPTRHLRISIFDTVRECDWSCPTIDWRRRLLSRLRRANAERLRQSAVLRQPLLQILSPPLFFAPVPGLLEVGLENVRGIATARNPLLQRPRERKARARNRRFDREGTDST